MNSYFEFDEENSGFSKKLGRRDEGSFFPVEALCATVKSPLKLFIMSYL